MSLILISDAVLSLHAFSISPRLIPSIPEVQILCLFLLEPVSSILLGYKVDGLMSKDGSLVVWVVEHVDVFGWLLRLQPCSS